VAVQDGGLQRCQGSSTLEFYSHGTPAWYY